MNNGAFHEALNMAALWKLPAIFICENNRYGMGTALERAQRDLRHLGARLLLRHGQRGGGRAGRAGGARGDGARGRSAPGASKHPTLLEVRTYRFMGHSMSDPIHGTYRTKEEVEDQRKRDPIALWSQRLIADGLIDEDAVRATGQGGAWRR